MFEVDGDWIDFPCEIPQKPGMYWAIFEDGQQRKARWIKGIITAGYWITELRCMLPDSWGGVQAWKPIDPANPNDD